MAETKPVLVVGGTGHVGGKVVDELLARAKSVRALVRPGSDASKLEAKGVEIARGDMLDLDSLIAAMTGVDAVITSAAGYTRRDKRALEIDTTGNTNLAVAASRTSVRRFILVSILTSDQTPNVPHFWHKKLTEDKLEELGVPFVALRPGAFLDQITQMGGDPFEKKRLTWFGTKTVPLTFVLTSDLAVYLAAAVDADVADGERIDIGWDRAVSMQDIADIASTFAGGQVRVRSMPSGLVHALGALMGPFVPMVKDMSSMLAWFETGKYVADTSRQAEIFGPVPTAENAVARFARSLGH
ncbi:NAD(P)H-binding protein [Arthrobacter sp. efr-133-TYG-118]|uniref:NmrA family NAD(P)-binding protein n=1 Tax=Arthrobacter sp. efr-133-TYG-118 TaxID=3040279 RepID=UPI00254E9266|nr:NAD(P)H-binding protein [Arthrobacter sp. efr-133-TYG-118]